MSDEPITIIHTGDTPRTLGDTRLADGTRIVVIGSGNVGQAIAEKLLANGATGIAGIVTIEARSTPMVEPSFTGMTKQDRRALDQQHWKEARRYRKK